MMEELLNQANVLLKFGNEKLIRLLGIVEASSNFVDTVEVSNYLEYSDIMNINNKLYELGQQAVQKFEEKYLADLSKYIDMHERSKRYEYSSLFKILSDYFSFKEILIPEKRFLIISILLFKRNFFLTIKTQNYESL